MLETDAQKKFYAEHKNCIELPGRNVVRIDEIVNSAVYDSEGNLIDVKYDFSKITIEVIANSLSKICRFAGHLKYFYSVAEHSVNMCDLLDNRQEKMQALLHEVSEMFTSDIPAPMKKVYPEVTKKLKEFEAIIEFGLFRQFGVRYPISDRVRELDMRLCASEAVQGGLKQFDWNKLGITKIKEFDASFLDWENARDMFVERWGTVRNSLA